MTDIEWGAEIAVNGVRPEWYSNERCAILNDQWQGLYEGGYNNFTDRSWGHIKAIRLPANHPYYLATSRGFTYWPGGESAPADWDGGEVLYREGNADNSCYRWSHYKFDDGANDIIGYRKRTEQPAPAIAPELVERMVAHLRECSEVHGIRPRDATAQRLYDEMKAIAALLPPKPEDPDMTLAKSIVGDAGAIALAIKAARENGRG